MNILSNIEKFTVSQLNYSIKNLIENKFQIVSVIGEVSQVKTHGSGHIYFSLKDEESVISSLNKLEKVENNRKIADINIFSVNNRVKKIIKFGL